MFKDLKRITLREYSFPKKEKDGYISYCKGRKKASSDKQSNKTESCNSKLLFEFLGKVYMVTTDDELIDDEDTVYAFCLHFEKAHYIRAVSADTAEGD